jgi:uncharacterized protein with PIN domain
MKTARFQFDDTLRPLLDRSKRSGTFEYSFSGPQSAKHLIESVGIPHTEVGAVQCGSRRVDLDYQVQDGDEIRVQSVAVRPPADEERLFVLDGHLGRLTSSLRMLGFDCLYESGLEDQELAGLAVAEDRFLLTRDRRLLMRKTVTRGYLVRSLDPNVQLVEVTQRFGLAHMFQPFRRCIRCNTLLRPVDKETVLDRLQPLTRRYFETFHICPKCGQVYWKGSHVEKMLQIIDRLTAAAGQAASGRGAASKQREEED